MEQVRFINVEATNKEVEALYQRAFPEEEKMPYSMLLEKQKSQNVEFLAAYDQELFVGLAYCVFYQDVLYIFYFAIDDKLRGQGYGSQVLQALQERYQDKRLVLSVEEVDVKYDNYDQRVKRLAFYQKNQFQRLNLKVKEGSVMYELLGFSRTGKMVSLEDYQELLKNYFKEYYPELFE